MCHLFEDGLLDVITMELQQVGLQNREMQTLVIGDCQDGPSYNDCNTNFAGGFDFKNTIAKRSSNLQMKWVCQLNNYI